MITGAYAAFESVLSGVGLSSLVGPLLALPIPVIIGVIYWLSRRAAQKKRLGEAFIEVRKHCRLNEIIRLLLVIWAAETAALTLVPVKIEFIVENYLRTGETVKTSEPMFYLSLSHYMSSLAHFFTGFRLSDVCSSHFIENTVYFVPFGLALPFILKKPTMLKTVLSGFFISLFIELYQPLILRSSDIGDLISNTCGTLFGYLIYLLLKKLLPRFTEKCRRAADISQKINTI